MKAYMMQMKTQQHLAASVLSLVLAGCADTETASIDPQTMADALFAVMAADRTVYSKVIVNRLVNEEAVIKASEHWRDDKALPLPAQVFRMGAEAALDKGANFNYSLLSLWPINKQNEPRTDAEKVGLKYLIDNPGKNYYGEEVLAGRRYFTAIYPDVAVAKACIECHNDHKDSSKQDFKIGDTMGGVAIRIPL